MTQLKVFSIPPELQESCFIQVGVSRFRAPLSSCFFFFFVFLSLFFKFDVISECMWEDPTVITQSWSAKKDQPWLRKKGWRGVGGGGLWNMSRMFLGPFKSETSEGPRRLGSQQASKLRDCNVILLLPLKVSPARLLHLFNGRLRLDWIVSCNRSSYCLVP